MWKRIRRKIRTLNSQQAYAQWAQTYAPQAHNRLMEAEEQAMLALIPPIHNRLVLDIACGSGRWGQWALGQGVAQVVGIDNSLPMLQRSILDAVCLGDMQTLPLPDTSIDVIICGLAIGHLPPSAMRQAVVEMGRVLKFGGIAVVSDLHPFQSWNGAQRTFQGTDGKTYAVEHYVHSYAAYHQATQIAGLHITDIREMSLSAQPENSSPVILALQFSK